MNLPEFDTLHDIQRQQRSLKDITGLPRLAVDAQITGKFCDVAILNYSNVNKLKSNCSAKKRIKVNYGDERNERRSIF